jgi:HSP20 family molecular chaperone IbpA
MIYQQQPVILPLSFDNLNDLISLNTDRYRPLAYRIEKKNTSQVVISVDIGQCDPDSIRVDVSSVGIHIHAKATVIVEMASRMVLSRNVSQTIPLAPGVDTSRIRSDITDTDMQIIIPFV